MAEHRFRKRDLVDIVLRRAVVRDVNPDGSLSLVHSGEEFDAFDPGGRDVQVTLVGHFELGDPEYDPLAVQRFSVPIPREDTP